MTTRHWKSTLLPVLLVTLGGCVAGGDEQGLVGFSPDGKTIVAWRSSTLSTEIHMPGFPYGVAGKSYSHTADIGWASVDQPDRIRWVRVPDFYPQFSYFDITFSPSGRRVGLLAGAAFVLDLATGQLNKLCEEDAISTVGWLSDNEVVYTALTFSGEKVAQTAHARVFRQMIDQPPGKRTETYHLATPRRKLDYHTSCCYGSPNGRYVILDMLPTLPAKLVNVLEGSATDFGPADAWAVAGIGWMADCSKVICCLQPNLSEGIERGWHFIVLETATGKTLVAHTEPDGEGGIRPDGPPSWPPDGKHVLINSTSQHHNYYLIRPDPWQAVRITEKINPACGFDDSPMPSIRPMPTPGWFLASNMRNPTYAVTANGDGRVLLSGDTDPMVLR
jgi:hypothetical protein